MFLKYAVLLFLGVCSAKKCHDDDIQRPCPDMDICCVRNYFAKHSSCEPVYTHLEDMEYNTEFTLALPHANASIKWTKPCVKGLNGVIKDFFINKDTNNLVLVVYYHKVTVSSSAATIKYYLNGREPLKLKDAISVTNRCVTQTITIPYHPVNGICWGEKDVYTYFGDAEFPSIWGKGFCNSDPEVRAAYNEVKGNLVMTCREAALIKGPYYFVSFFENNICKF